jgi:hypothetical protein
MKSTKCPACGYVSFSNAQTCKGCGETIVQQSHEFTPAPLSYSDNYSENDGDWNESSGEVKSGLAIFGLVLGIIGFFTFGLLGIGAVVGIIVSVKAMKRVREDPWAYGGRSMAIAGLVLNIVSLTSAVPIGIIAAIAIPNLLAARMAANEGAALSSLRTVANAEATFQSEHGRYASLEELGDANLIDSLLAHGAKSGYRFTVEVKPKQSYAPEGFAVMAMPQTYQSSGRRSFFIDESMVMRAADTHGLGLTGMEPPLQQDYEMPPMRTTQRSYRQSSGY